MNERFSSIWHIDRNLSGATTHKQDTHWGSLTPLPRCSRWIQQPQPTRQKCKFVVLTVVIWIYDCLRKIISFLNFLLVQWKTKVNALKWIGPQEDFFLNY